MKNATQRKNFYLVDDSGITAATIQALLENAGHYVTSTTNSAFALAQIPLAKPDCVIVDLMMPGLNGFQLLEYLAGEEVLEKTKWVVLSGKSDMAAQKQAKELGAHLFLRKPVNPGQFVGQVMAVFEQK